MVKEYDVKIYIKNITLQKIQDIIKNGKIKHLLNKQYNQTVFYSRENGIFIEESENENENETKNKNDNKKTVLYYLEPTNNEIYEECDYKYSQLNKNINIYNLIIDFTEEIKINVVSQFPIEYIMHKIKIREYKLHEKSMLTLIVSGFLQENSDFIVTDFYFRCIKNMFTLENIFFQKELNEFLTILN